MSYSEHTEHVLDKFLDIPDEQIKGLRISWPLIKFFPEQGWAVIRLCRTELFPESPRLHTRMSQYFETEGETIQYYNQMRESS